MVRHGLLWLFFVLAASITACSQYSAKHSETATARPTPASDISSIAMLPSADSEVQQSGNHSVMQARQQILELGTGIYVEPPPVGAGTTPSEGEIHLNFDNVDLVEFVSAVLGGLLNEAYVIDEKVGGKVTLHTERGLTKDGVFNVLNEILAMNDARIVKADGMYKVLPSTLAARAVTPTLRTEDSAYSIRVIPLEFLAASEMQKILEPFLGDPSDLRIDTRRNLIIVGGTPNQLSAITDTIAMFDVDWLRGVSVGLYPLRFVDAASLTEELDAIMSAMQGDESAKAFDGLARVVPVERLNSVILIGKTARALRELELWLHRLDTPGESTAQNLFVYEVQNAKAVELAQILHQIFDGRGPQTDGGPSALAPGLRPVEIGGSDRNVNANALGDFAQGTGIDTFGEVQIIADDRRNSLVILAAEQDYRMVESAIKKLDVVPLQVLIQASILEVTLRDDLSYGVEWFFKNGLQGGSSGKAGIGRLDLGSTGISALSPSFSYTVIDNVDQVRIALNALANESEVNILSSPSLMVLDNETATINVGDEIPVPTRQAVSTIDPDAPTVNEIQFRKTGVALTVTPRVNNSGLVTMEIDQEVSSATATTSSELDAPTIQNRGISSTVAVNTGETIVLGGLIQDTQSESESGIPLLRDIPMLGKLFSQTASENLRTELLVMITPKVVRRAQDARQVTEELRRELKGLKLRNNPS